MMAGIVVRGAAGARLRRKRALLLFRGLEQKTQNACTYDEYRRENGNVHVNGSSGCTSIPR